MKTVTKQSLIHVGRNEKFLTAPATDLNVAEARSDPVHDNSLDPPVLRHLPARADLTGEAGLRVRSGPGTGQCTVIDVDLDGRSFILTKICSGAC